MKKFTIKLMATVVNFFIEAAKTIVRRPILGALTIATSAIHIAIAAKYPIGAYVLIWFFVGLAPLAVLTMTKVSSGNIYLGDICNCITGEDPVVKQFDRYTKPNETIVLISNGMKYGIAGMASFAGIILFAVAQFPELQRYFEAYYAARGMVYTEYLAQGDVLRWGVLHFLAIAGTAFASVEFAELALLTYESMDSKLKVVRSSSALADASLDLEELPEIPEIPFQGSYREVQEILDAGKSDARYERLVETTKNQLLSGIEVPDFLIRDLHLVSFAAEVRAKRDADRRRKTISHRRVG